MKSAFMTQREMIFLVSVFLAGSILLFMNLGNIYLWQDEAQTALLAKSILKYGIPGGYDGLNYFSQEPGAEYGDNFVWKWHPWLQFYLLAPFFKVFGTSTFVARLPFAIAGLASMMALYIFGRSLWNNKRAAAMAVLFLLLCVPFLILTCQCRYYSLTALFTVGTLYGYHLIVERRRFGSGLYLVSATLLFDAHYLYMLTAVCAALSHILLFYRSEWKKMAWVTAGILLLNAPWIIWFHGMTYEYGARVTDFRELGNCFWALAGSSFVNI